MLPDDPLSQGRLFYLLLLLLGIGGFFFFGPGQRLGKSIRDLVIWLLIFAMVVIAYGFRDTLRTGFFPNAAVQISDDAIELRRGAGGHFHAELELNGTPVRLVIDTGASDIVLSRRDAEAIGIDVERLDFTGRAVTANGAVSIAPVRLGSVRFGTFRDVNVPASVNGGALDGSLLGMSYLDRFSRIEISGDRMRLYR